MGHSCALHVALSELNPGQADPPLDGAGLLHNLDLDEVPPPQVRLQVEKELHAPHIPSEIHLRFHKINITVF